MQMQCMPVRILEDCVLNSRISLFFIPLPLPVRREEEQEVSEHREAGQARTELMQLYIDYRLKRIVTGVWAKVLWNCWIIWQF